MTHHTHHTDTAAHRLLRDLLHPEALGHAVSAEVRARARLALAADAAAGFDPGRIYLAGPMTGIDNYNHPAFNEAAARLREAGYTVWNPAQNGVPREAPWHEHMRRDITALMTCGRVALLPGWPASHGARLEADIAERLYMQIMTVDQWLDIATATAGAPTTAEVQA